MFVLARRRSRDGSGDHRQGGRSSFPGCRGERHVWCRSTVRLCILDRKLQFRLCLDSVACSARLKDASREGLREVISVSALYFILAAIAATAFYFVALLIAPILLGETFHVAIPLPEVCHAAAIVLQGYFMHNMKFLHFDKSIALMSMLSILDHRCSIFG